MAVGDPVIVPCSADSWTPVALNVWFGTVSKLYDDDDIADPTAYLQTYRVAGEPAPTLKTEGVVCFKNGESELILSWWGIDVYIWPIGKDGQVRVNLP